MFIYSTIPLKDRGIIGGFEFFNIKIYHYADSLIIFAEKFMFNLIFGIMKEIYLVCSDVYVDSKLIATNFVFACSSEKSASDTCKREQLSFNSSNDMAFYHRIVYYKTIYLFS